uniref:Uncharacterized protein n=1 Tax=Myotis myotis TaxID=51298 RepID=A0A7J8ALK5_MYOMY|nr:hypothetical protein mMyoMyo1_007953 [Myotis myotis]
MLNARAAPWYSMCSPWERCSARSWAHGWRVQQWWREPLLPPRQRQGCLTDSLGWGSTGSRPKQSVGHPLRAPGLREGASWAEGPPKCTNFVHWVSSVCVCISSESIYMCVYIYIYIYIYIY